MTSPEKKRTKEIDLIGRFDLSLKLVTNAMLTTRIGEKVSLGQWKGRPRGRRRIREGLPCYQRKQHFRIHQLRIFELDMKTRRAKLFLQQKKELVAEGDLGSKPFRVSRKVAEPILEHLL